MIDRIHFLLDRPLDPLAARAVVIFATAILLGFAAIFVLGTSRSGDTVASHERAAPARPQPPHVLGRLPAGAAQPVRRWRWQDPQDEKGSPAAGRAARALRSHRALQHVPYRNGGLTVVLVGTRGQRAELRASAPTIQAAREGWHRFLRRYRDSGRAYIPLFRGTNGGPGG